MKAKHCVHLIVKKVFMVVYFHCQGDDIYNVHLSELANPGKHFKFYHVQFLSLILRNRVHRHLMPFQTKIQHQGHDININ